MIEKLIDICKTKKNIYIQTHDYPDPDAVSSAFALKTLLELNSVEAKIVYVGKIDRISTERMVSLFRIDIQSFDGNYNDGDNIILVDSQNKAGNVTINGGNVFASVDHHPTGVPCEYEYQQLNLIGACASVLTNEYIETNTEMPEDVATALLYGLKMDTLNFTRGTTETDISCFSYLLCHSDKENLRFLETSNLILSDLKAFGLAIENIKVIADIGISFVPFDCPDGLISALSDFMLSIDEISISIVFSQREYGIKLSVRSILPYVDAGVLTKHALAGIGSGGGHPSFAGGFIPKGSLESIEDDKKIQFLCNKFMNSYKEIMWND